MRRPSHYLCLLPFCLALSLPALAQPPVPPASEMPGYVDPATIVPKLKDLQKRLANGDQIFFTLISGAPAAYPMADVSPRDAFLNMPFDKTSAVTRVPTDNRLWQPFTLWVQPDGPGQSLWEIEVVININGNVERVEMIYGPPAPF